MRKPFFPIASRILFASIFLSLILAVGTTLPGRSVSVGEAFVEPPSESELTATDDYRAERSHYISRPAILEHFLVLLSLFSLHDDARIQTKFKQQKLVSLEISRPLLKALSILDRSSKEPTSHLA